MKTECDMSAPASGILLCPVDDSCSAVAMTTLSGWPRSPVPQWPGPFLLGADALLMGAACGVNIERDVSPATSAAVDDRGELEHLLVTEPGIGYRVYWS